MSRTSIRYVAAIARALHHKCAPTPDQETQAQNLEELAEMMARNNTLRKVKKPYREVARWIRGRRFDATPNLIHETTTNRLMIEATEDGVTLDFWAGAIEDRSHPEGGLVTALRITENPDGSTKIQVLVVTDVLRQRPDRIALLADIDRQVGGEITRYLNNHPDPGAQHLCWKLMQALSGRCTACGGSGLANLDYAFVKPCAKCNGSGTEPTKQTTQVA